MRKRAQHISRPRRLKKKTLGIVVIIFFIIIITYFLTNLINWEESDYRRMYSPQLPNSSSTGLSLCMKGDINPYTSFADDFFWNDSSLIREINLWGSFKGDTLPENGVGSLTFQIVIHEDDNNKPGSNLWKKTFYPGDYYVKLYEESWQSWYCFFSNAFNQDDYKNTYQYDFFILEGFDFYQNTTEVYWLEVRWIHENIDYNFGWKTTRKEDHWKENAYIYDGSNWTPLIYPSRHVYNNQKINLAFEIH